MPKELDFEPMPKRQQNVYIIWDSEDITANAAEGYKQHIDALIKQFQCEAQYHSDVAFNLCLTEYQDTYNWGKLISSLWILMNLYPSIHRRLLINASVLSGTCSPRLSQARQRTTTLTD